ALSPNSTTAGGPAFALTVDGVNFDGTAQVQWNGSVRPTGFVSATRVTAQIAAGDIASGGTFTVTVLLPAPAGGSFSNAAFTVYNPAPAIAGLSPSSAQAGGGGFTLTVNGSGFVPPGGSG